MIDENIIARSLRGDSRQWLDKIFIAAATIFFFLLPIQTRWIFREAPLYEWGTLSLYGIEILGWVVIGLGLFSRYRHSERSEESPAHASTHIRVGSLAESTPHRACSGAGLGMTLVGLALLSIIWAPDKAVALQAAVRLLEGVLIYFVISTCTTPNPSSPRRGNESISSPARGEVRRGGSEWIMYALLVGATLQALLGIFQFLTQSSFSSTWLGMALHDPAVLGTAVMEVGDARWLRAYGGLPHPNVFGGYLAVALGVLVFIRNKEQGTRNNLLFALCSLFFVTGIFFSFSRAAWVAAAFVIGWGLLLTIVKSRPHVPLLVIGWVVVFILVYWPLVSARLAPRNLERLEVKSRVERVQGVREAWELIKKHPMVGAGIGNYTQVVARELRPRYPLYTYQPVHSVPLLVWAELGIVGLLLLVGALYKIARQSKFYILHFAFLVLLLFDHYLWSLPFGILLFWAILGLSTAKNNTPS